MSIPLAVYALKRDRDQKQWEHVNLMTAWIDTVRSLYEDDGGVVHDKLVSTLHLHNASKQPMIGIQVHARHRPRPFEELLDPVLLVALPTRVLAPGESIEALWPQGVFRPDEGKNRAVLFFRDARGTVWRRDLNDNETVIHDLTAIWNKDMKRLAKTLPPENRYSGLRLIFYRLWIRNRRHDRRRFRTR